MDSFVLLRPWWLLTILPLALLFFQLYRTRSNGSSWEQVIDPALAEYVLEPASSRPQRNLLWLLGLAWLLVVIALAGPSWEKQEMPVYQGQDAQVILLDLSRSMDADDIQPSRLTRARFKLSDLLQRSQGMQIGLIVFSEVPYVVSPLTDDIATLEAFLPALTTSVIPVQGGKIGPAINRAQSLLEQAGIGNASVTLITDSRADSDALAAADKLTEAGHSMSVLGVGTTQGVPVKAADGSFIEDANGKIVLPKLDKTSLRQLAASAGGIYQDINDTDEDLDALTSALRLSGKITEPAEETRQTTNWIEQGPWLLCLVSLMALYLFRRGLL